MFNQNTENTVAILLKQLCENQNIMCLFIGTIKLFK